MAPEASAKNMRPGRRASPSRQRPKASERESRIKPFVQNPEGRPDFFFEAKLPVFSKSPEGAAKSSELSIQAGGNPKRIQPAWARAARSIKAEKRRTFFGKSGRAAVIKRQAAQKPRVEAAPHKAPSLSPEIQKRPGRSGGK